MFELYFHVNIVLISNISVPALSNFRCWYTRTGTYVRVIITRQYRLKLEHLGPGHIHKKIVIDIAIVKIEQVTLCHVKWHGVRALGESTNRAGETNKKRKVLHTNGHLGCGDADEEGFDICYGYCG